MSNIDQERNEFNMARLPKANPGKTELTSGIRKNDQKPVDYPGDQPKSAFEQDTKIVKNQDDLKGKPVDTSKGEFINSSMQGKSGTKDVNINQDLGYGASNVSKDINKDLKGKFQDKESLPTGTSGGKTF